MNCTGLQYLPKSSCLINDEFFLRNHFKPIILIIPKSTYTKVGFPREWLMHLRTKVGFRKVLCE